MPTFTMEEFIAKHKLGVEITNPAATKLIAKKLKSLGFRKVRTMYKGERQNVWTDDNDLEELQKKLASLKL